MFRLDFATVISMSKVQLRNSNPVL